MNIQLGDKVVDKVTGFTGIVTARLKFLNGCVQYAVKPRIQEDGKMPEAEWIDWQQLAVVDSEGKFNKETARTGGPMPNAPKSYTG